jgi:hypothetical protein
MNQLAGDVRKNLSKMMYDYAVSQLSFQQQLQVVTTLAKFSTRIETLIESRDQALMDEVARGLLHDFAIVEIGALKEYIKNHQKEVEQVLPELTAPMKDFLEESPYNEEEDDEEDMEEFFWVKSVDFRTPLHKSVTF